MACSDSLTSDQVPDNYKEAFILSGYRRPRSSFLQCLLSVVKLNNETLNIWTHLLPFITLLIYFIWSFPFQIWPFYLIPLHTYPMVAMEISILTYLLGSSVAHTFNCMSSKIRHICFYLDYTAISVFGVAGSCATFFYLRPSEKHNFFLYSHPNIFIAGSVLVNLAQIYVSCFSRHSWIVHRYAIRTIAFSLVFMYGNFPNYHRFCNCMLGNEEDCPSRVSLFILGYSSYIISAILNVVRVPERYFPYVFDIIGHNHQWVHVVTTLGTISHFNMVKNDMEAREQEHEYLLNGMNGWNTLGCTAITAILGLVFITWLGYHLTEDGHLHFSCYGKRLKQTKNE